jgi:hypothetical protein
VLIGSIAHNWQNNICDERRLDVGLESVVFHLKIIMLAKIKEQTLQPVLF